MSRRTAVYILILGLVAAGIYWLSYQHRVRQTSELMTLLASPDHIKGTEAMGKLKAHGIDVQERLADSLTSKVSRVRWRSAVLLGQLNDPSAAEPLMQRLDDPEPQVQAAAVRAVGQLGVKSAIPRLTTMLSGDSEPVVQIAAAQALGLLGAEDAVGALITALAEQETPEEDQPQNGWQLAVAAAQALGSIGTAEAGIALMGAVHPDQQPDERVRQAAAYALSDAAPNLQDHISHDETRPCSIVQALLVAGKDDQANVRVAAIHSLLLVPAPSSQQQTVAQLIEQARSDPHYWVRQVAQAGPG